jgi:hypothetical protein
VQNPVIEFLSVAWSNVNDISIPTATKVIRAKHIEKYNPSEYRTTLPSGTTVTIVGQYECMCQAQRP